MNMIYYGFFITKTFFDATFKGYCTLTVDLTTSMTTWCPLQCSNKAFREGYTHTAALGECLICCTTHVPIHHFETAMHSLVWAHVLCSMWVRSVLHNVPRMSKGCYCRYLGPLTKAVAHLLPYMFQWRLSIHSGYASHAKYKYKYK